MISRPTIFNSQSTRSATSPIEASAKIFNISSVARSMVAAPPMAISEVEVKKAAPFCRLAMMAESTMRTSRRDISSIQRVRYWSMEWLRPCRCISPSRTAML